MSTPPHGTRSPICHAGLPQIQDLDTANGTFVDEKPIISAQRIALKPGQAFTLGASTSRYLLPSATMQPTPSNRQASAMAALARAPAPESARAPLAAASAAEAAAMRAMMPHLAPVVDDDSDASDAPPPSSGQASAAVAGAAAARAGPAHAWPTAQWTVLGDGELEAAGRMTCVAFDPAGSRVVTGGTKGMLRFYDFGGMDRTQTPFRLVNAAEGQHIQGLSWAPNGSAMVVTCGWQPRLLSRDGSAQITFSRGDPYIKDVALTRGHISEVTAAVWSPADDRKIISASLDGSVRVWDVQGKTNLGDLLCAQTFKLPSASAGRVAGTAVAWSSDAKSILIGTGAGSLMRWDMRAGYASGDPVPGAHGDAITCVAVRRAGGYVLPDPSVQRAGSGSGICEDTLFATRGEDDCVRVWDTRMWGKSMAQIAGVPTVFAGQNLAWAPDGSMLLVAPHARPGKGSGAVWGFHTTQLQGPVSAEAAALVHHVPSAAAANDCVLALDWCARTQQVGYGAASGSATLSWSREQSWNGVLLSTARAAKDTTVTANIRPEIRVPGSGPRGRAARAAAHTAAQEQRAKQHNVPAQAQEEGQGRVKLPVTVTQYYAAKHLAATVDLSDTRTRMLSRAPDPALAGMQAMAAPLARSTLEAELEDMSSGPTKRGRFDAPALAAPVEAEDNDSDRA